MNLEKLIKKLQLHVFSCNYYNNNSSFDEDSWKFHFLRLLFYGVDKSSHTPAELNNSVEFFNAALQTIYFLPCQFDGGGLGIIWSIKKLAEFGIVSLPETYQEITRSILQRYVSYYRNSPFQYDYRDNIYPVGIIMILLSSKEDTIQRYSWNESTIHKIRDCERILTEKLIPLNNPTNLTAGILHSMMYFMMEAKERKIFPKKAIELIEIIKKLSYDQSQSKRSDVQILNYLIGNDWKSSLMKLSLDKCIELLGEIGWYSFVYQMPKMFLDVYDYITKQNSKWDDNFNDIPIHTIVGLSFGCISNKIKE